MGVGREILDLASLIEYSFNDISHLEIALTHKSYTNAMKKRGFRADSYESYEFLGDAILELVISDELFSVCKDDEGKLTQMRQALVCEPTLAKIARSISLGEYLCIGDSEEHTGIRDLDKILADALEAVIAAVYLDSKSEHGLEKVRKLIIKFFAQEISLVVKMGSIDYKSMLKQLVEKNQGAELHYEHESSGQDHCKIFIARAIVNNNQVGIGEGRTKRIAEMHAAKNALKLFGVID